MHSSLFDEAVKGKICCIDDFLPLSTCRYIIKELQYSFWQPSTVIQKKGDEAYQDAISAARVSATAHQEWFTTELDTIIKEIEQKLEEELDVPADYCERWQATRYPLHGKFDYHVDAGYWKETFAGERVKTILLYLDTPEEGGSTHFRALHKTFEARQGRLLVWDNVLPNGNADYTMIHSGMPLLKGEKTTLVTWQRQLPFRNS